MASSSKSKTRISITIIPVINTMLKNVSEKSGISKSLLVEQAVKEFLKKQLDKDSKELAKLSFDDLPTEDEWISIQSPIE